MSRHTHLLTETVIKAHPNLIHLKVKNILTNTGRGGRGKTQGGEGGDNTGERAGRTQDGEGGARPGRRGRG